MPTVINPVDFRKDLMCLQVPWECEPVSELFIALLPFKDPMDPHEAHHFILQKAGLN